MARSTSALVAATGERGGGVCGGCWGKDGVATSVRRGSLRPFAPAVPVEPVCLQTAPECRAADAQIPGGLRELPVVRVQHLDDSLFLPVRQRGGTLNYRNEHRLAQLQSADAKRTEPAPKRRQPRQQIARIRAQVHASSASRACWFAYITLPWTSNTMTPSLNPSRSARASGEKTDGWLVVVDPSVIYADT